MRKLVVMVLAFALLAAAVFAFLPAIIEALLNRVQWRPPYPAPDWALAVAADEVDLHADPLLWGRDLLERGSRGHVDLPRLLEVGALLQVFGVVTQAPLGMNVTRNPNDAADMITGLAIVSRWPRQTWKSRRERALYLAQRLRETAARSAGKLVLVRSRADLEALLTQRRAGSHAVGAILGLEGSQALEGDLESISALFAAGFRMMAPTHFVDTEISGSAHGEEKGGLTPLGRRWLATLEEKRILVDLAHASPQTLRDVLAAARRPVVVSHTGVKATCDSPRNAPRRRRDGRRARRAGKRFRRGGQAALRRHGSSAPRRGPPRRTLQRCAGPSHLHRQCRRILVEVTALTVYCARLA